LYASFSFRYTATIHVDTLSLHDALPISKGWGSQPAAASPEQLQRLLDLDRDYLDKLKAFPFGALNTNGQVDFVLLNRRIKRDITDRKSTRLNSSHAKISYAVFCLKKKIK